MYTFRHIRKRSRRLRDGLERHVAVWLVGRKRGLGSLRSTLGGIGKPMRSKIPAENLEAWPQPLCLRADSLVPPCCRIVTGFPEQAGPGSEGSRGQEWNPPILLGTGCWECG